MKLFPTAVFSFSVSSMQQTRVRVRDPRIFSCAAQALWCGKLLRPPTSAQDHTKQVWLWGPWDARTKLGFEVISVWSPRSLKSTISMTPVTQRKLKQTLSTNEAVEFPTFRGNFSQRAVGKPWSGRHKLLIMNRQAFIVFESFFIKWLWLNLSGLFYPWVLRLPYADIN